MAGIIISTAALFFGARAVYRLLELPPTPEAGSRDPLRNKTLKANLERLGEPMPVLLGTYRIYPDLRANSFTDVRGGETLTYLNLTVCIGEADVTDIKLGESLASGIEGLQTAVYRPGEALTLYPANVYTSPDINNVELEPPSLTETDETCTFRGNRVIFGPPGTFSGLSAGDTLLVSGAAPATQLAGNFSLLNQQNAQGFNLIDPNGQTDFSVLDRAGPLTLQFGSSAMSTLYRQPLAAAEPAGLAIGADLPNATGATTITGSDTNNGSITLLSVNSNASQITVAEPLQDETAAVRFTRLTGGSTAFVRTSQQGQLINEVGITMSYLIYRRNGDGFLRDKFVRFAVNLQPVNDAGTPIGMPFEIGQFLIGGQSTSPEQDAFNFTGFPLGQYRLQVQRITPDVSDDGEPDDTSVVDVRGYIPGEVRYADTTQLVAIVPSDAIGQSSANRINCVATKKLPVYESGGWTEPRATDDIAWHVWDICTNTEYGRGLPAEAIDLEELLRLNEVWKARGDTIGGLVNSGTTFWPLLENMLRIGRTRPIAGAGFITFWRDEPSDIVQGHFNDRNILPDSLELTESPKRQGEPNSLEIEYIDGTTWQKTSVLCRLPGAVDDGLKPTRRTLDYCIDRQQAYREGLYILAVDQYRRESLNFSSERGGSVMGFGGHIDVTRPTANNGQGSDIIGAGLDDNDRAVLLSREPLEWSAAGPYTLRLWDERGNVNAPITAERGETDRHIVVTDGSTPAVTTDPNAVQTLFTLSTTDHTPLRCITMNRTRGEGEQWQLETLIDDPRVHDFDSIAAPDGNAVAEAAENLSIASVSAVSNSDGSALAISYTAAADAQQYIIDIGNSNGFNYRRVAQIRGTQFILPTEPGDVKWVSVRVAAIGGVRGPSVSTLAFIGSASPPRPVSNLETQSPFTGDFVKWQWGPGQGATSYRVRIFGDDGVGNTLFRVVTTQSLSFTYTLGQCTEDGGPLRWLTIEVSSLNDSGQSTSKTLTSINPAPTVLFTPVANDNGGINERDYTLSWQPSPAVDLAGYIVWASDSPGFTPAPENQIYRGPAVEYRHTSPPGQSVYWRAAAFDVWGERITELNLTAEQSY